jgi:Leucine-rich repeat (LRR) protein
MSEPKESVPGTVSEAWARREGVLEAFENAWRQGQRPDLDQFLAEAGPADAGLLFDLAEADLEWRLKAGEAARVEDYLGRYPPLADDRSRLLELIVREFTWRLASGSGTQADEYLRRFPQYADELPSLLQDAARAHTAAGPGGEPQPGATPAHEGPATLRQNAPPPSATGPVAVDPTPSEATDVIERIRANLAPPQGPDELGRLGPYRVLKALGVGGMGIVLLAEDPSLQRLVALKVMLPELAASRSARGRFLREARAVAALKHERIVTIHQVGEDRGLPFLAMEWLEGETLESLLQRRGSLPPAEAARIGREVAEGLAVAHGQGIVHRDVKPANVWLEAPSGRVKLLDFGLARAGRDGELTVEGAVLGTPSYMSPEQARGKPADARSDLFGLGCILYRLLTGEPPFKGTDTFSILLAVTAEDPRPPRKKNPAVPAALSDLVLQLLAKDADRRPQDAATVARALQAIEAEVGAAARSAATQQGGRRRWRRSVMAAVTLLGVLAVGYFFAPSWIRIITNRGQVILEVDDPGIEVTVRENGAVIQDHPGQRVITVAAGEHELEVVIKDPSGETRFATKKFTLKRNGKAVVNVRAEWGRAKPEAGPEQRAAQRVLALGGKLNVRVAGEGDKEVRAAGQLPERDVQVVGIDLTHNAAVRDADLEIFKALPSLERLYLDDTATTDAGLQHVKQLTRLTSLRLVNTRLTDAGLALLKGLTNLEDLDLRGTQVSDAGLEQLQSLTRLKNLSLVGTRCRGAGVAALQKALPGVRILWDPEVANQSTDRRVAQRVLAFGGKVTVRTEGGEAREIGAIKDLPAQPFQVIGIGAEGTVDGDGLLHDLKGLQHLDGLSLARAKITDAGLANLKDMTQLTWLELGETSIGDAGLAHLANLTNLSFLGVSQTELTDNGLVHLKKLNKLGTLHIGGTQLSGVGLVHLQGLANLDVIDAATSQVTDNGLEHIKGLTKLRILNLFETHVSDSGLEHLKGLTKLTSLNLARTQVRGPGLAYLKGLQDLAALGLADSLLDDTGMRHLAGCKSLTNLTVGTRNVTDDGLAHVKGLINLTRLSVARSRVTDRGLGNIKGLTNLTWLELNDTQVTDAGLKHLYNLARLQEVLLQGTPVTADGIAALHQALPAVKIVGAPAAESADRRMALRILSFGGKITVQAEDGETREIGNVREFPAWDFHITTIDVTSNPKVDDTLLGDLKEVPHLKMLWADRTKITDAGLVHLKGMTNLTHLGLEVPGVTDAGLVHLAPLTQLTVLGLGNSRKITDAGLAHLGKLTNLLSLHLANTGVNDAGLVHLAALKNLQELELGFTSVSDDGLKHLKALTKLWKLGLYGTRVRGAGLVHLEGLKHLRALNLQGSLVSDAALVHVKGLTQLTALVLNQTNVTDTGLEHLHGLKRLQEVYLNGTKVTASGVAALKKAVPEVQVFWVPPPK